jgi:DNA-binding NarL/FixJ family response regulator
MHLVRRARAWYIHQDSSAGGSVAQILVLVDDIFFQAKMLETAKHAGVEMKAFASGEALLVEISEAAPNLVVVDLNARHAPMETVASLRSLNSRIPVLGFFSHVQTEIAERALEAGCTQVMPRSKFTKDLSAIFSRAKS